MLHLQSQQRLRILKQQFSVREDQLRERLVRRLRVPALVGSAPRPARSASDVPVAAPGRPPVALPTRPVEQPSPPPLAQPARAATWRGRGKAGVCLIKPGGEYSAATGPSRGGVVFTDSRLLTDGRGDDFWLRVARVTSCGDITLAGRYVSRDPTSLSPAGGRPPPPRLTPG